MTMRNDTLLKKTLDQQANFAADGGADFELDRTERPSVKPGEYHWEGDVFHRAGRSSCDLSEALQALDVDTKESFKAHWLSFANEGLYSRVSIMTAIIGLGTALKRFPTRAFDVGWISKALSVSGFIINKARYERFFAFWRTRADHAVSADALRLLRQTAPKENGSRNVLSDDPEKGWLTEGEYDALLGAVWNHYDSRSCNTQTTLMRLLSMQYARRPSQLAALKFGDLREGKADDHSQIAGRRIRFPGVKDFRAETGFRDGRFEVHPLADHLWDLFQIQRQEIKRLFENTLDVSLTDTQVNELPVFCRVTEIERAVETLTNHFQVDWCDHLGSELFHMSTENPVSPVLRWTTGVSLYGHGDRQARVEPPISHRTGKPLKVNSNRLRHTRARQLARRGVPKHVLSHWLGHISEKAIDAYYDDPAEEARQLDKAMSPILQPLAMAFSGKLIDSEADATRADDPTSRLEHAADGKLKTIGNCGRHSFCATTSVPIPCYRCKFFVPLVTAPHQEVLDALLQRQAGEEKMLKIGGQRRLLVPIDLSADIRAVRSCIAHCDVRKAELEEVE